MHIQKMDSIIEQCKNGDKAAQFAVYKQYYKAMYNTSFRIVNDSFEAEDIMQESFLAAFTKLDSFSGTVTFGAWLKRIVINKSIDLLKSKKQHMLELEEVHLKVVDSSYESEWLVDDTITLDEVKRAIEKLPEKYQYVVMLYLIEGYDHQEIAEILNITEVASRTQLSRGKEQLKELLTLKNNGTARH